MCSQDSWCDAGEWSTCACVPNYQPRERCSNLTLNLQMTLRKIRGGKTLEQRKQQGKRECVIH